MKFIDLLKVTDGNAFLVVSMSVCGMQFETRHSAESFINNGVELNDRKIAAVRNIDGEIIVQLEN